VITEPLRHTLRRGDVLYVPQVTGKGKQEVRKYVVQRNPPCRGARRPCVMGLYILLPECPLC
jgi:hypothetical protein